MPAHLHGIIGVHEPRLPGLAVPGKLNLIGEESVVLQGNGKIAILVKQGIIRLFRPALVGTYGDLLVQQIVDHLIRLILGNQPGLTGFVHSFRLRENVCWNVIQPLCQRRHRQKADQHQRRQERCQSAFACTHSRVPPL